MNQQTNVILQSIRISTHLFAKRIPGQLLILFFGSLCGQGLLADDTRPAVVEIREILENTYSLRIIPPPGIGAEGVAQVSLPDTCTPASINQMRRPGATAQRYTCSEPLSNQMVGIEFPGLTRAFHTVVRFTRISGEEHSDVLAPRETEWWVPSEQTLAQVGGSYLSYGVVHILKGWDHLLFVLCLIWIAETWRRILLTITGFTIAHSITLVLSALDLVRLATPPVEAGIALSVAFLASEVIRNSRESLSWRYPISIACIFGLVHGLGFASVLRDIGLPQLHLAPALVSFNLGVEIGQVMFALPVAYVIRQFTVRDWPVDTMRKSIGYIVGCVAAFWFVERLAKMLAIW